MSPQAFSDGFAPALGVSALLSLAGAIAGAALPGRRTAPEVSAAPALAGVEGTREDRA